MALSRARLSDLNNPTSVYNFDCRSVFEIDVEGDYAYLTSGNGGIVIVDISELGNYRVIKRYNTSIEYKDVKIRDNYRTLRDKSAYSS